MHSPPFFLKKLAFSCIILSVIGAAISGCAPEGSSVSGDTDSAERTSYLMNTMVVQKWYGDNAEKTCDEIEDALSEFEKSYSLYIEESEINKINDAAGSEYVSVSDELYELISRSKELAEESDGAFDITIGPLSLLWDVSGQSGTPHVPDEADIEEALKKVDYTKILLNSDDKSVMLEEAGMKIDPGGDAKGYAAALMRDIAEENGVSGYLSIGGNMLVIGKNEDGSDFRIGIRDPLKDANSYFATISLDGYTMATSSTAEIYFEEDGVKYHHILDPSTGYPAESDLIQVSVISKDGLLADALSTTIFIKGSGCLEEYMNRDDCMVIAVTDENEVYASEGAWEILSPTDQKSYTFIRSGADK